MGYYGLRKFTFALWYCTSLVSNKKDLNNQLWVGWLVESTNLEANPNIDAIETNEFEELAPAKCKPET